MNIFLPLHWMRKISKTTKKKKFVLNLTPPKDTPL
jgi:hypothetical protein